MTIKYLLDTNIISNSMRNVPNAKLIEKLKNHQIEISTATLVIHELLYGCWRLPESKKRQFFQEYINDLILNIPLLDYDLKSAQYHAQERARLSKIGKTTAFVDGQITSIAVTNNLILITNNVDDFQDFQNLVIENWLN